MTSSSAPSVLTRTLRHLPGIGPSKEDELRRLGVDDWPTLFAEAAHHFGGRKLAALQRALATSIEHWEARDFRYFARVLPTNERWRLVDVFHPDVSYFDIEATGGGAPPMHASTAIGFLHRGELVQEFEYSRKKELLERIQDEAKLLCTFNGMSYDVPFLRKEFGIPLDQPHVDLFPWLKRQGLGGGLKAIQHSQTHLRQREFPDVNGYDAVRLWRLYEQGIPEAMDALLTYNAEDVLILPGLLVDAYHREIERYPDVGLPLLQPESLPSLTTRVSERIYRLLRARTSAEGSQAIDYLGL